MVLEWCEGGNLTKDKNVKQKMVLLFHRSEISDRVVKGIFQNFISNTFGAEPENSQGLKSISSRMDSFLMNSFKSIKSELFQKHLLAPLIVYDEVQVLATKFENYERQQSPNMVSEGWSLS
jgi:hypothetical protein